MHRNIAMYSRKTCFFPMLVVCLFWDLTKCLRPCVRLEQVQPKGQNKKDEGCRVYMHPCCMYWAVCYSLAKPSYHWKSKRKRMSYWMLRVYIANPCHVISSKHTVYFACNKTKGADIVGSINHMTSLTNRFLKLISLPTSTIFVSGISESVSYFLKFSCITTILKILECKSYKQYYPCLYHAEELSLKSVSTKLVNIFLYIY